MVRRANHFALAGLAFLAVAMTAAVTLVTSAVFGTTAGVLCAVGATLAFAVCWGALPLQPAPRAALIAPSAIPGNGREMGIMDKITGRAKKAAGDITDDASLRQQGRKEEQKGDAKENAARQQEKADAESERAAKLERET